jgi:type I restriction enzyme S subunit
MTVTTDVGAREWADVSVGEIVAPGPYSAATGPFGSSIGSRFFRTSGVPVIRGGNLSADTSIRLRDSDLVFLTKEKAAEFPRSTVRSGDLVFTCWGTINQVGLIDDEAAYPEYVISNKQMKLTPNPKRASSEFLYFLFSGPAMQREILNGTIGSSIPGFNLTRLRSIRILLPPLEEQSAIARALSDADQTVRAINRLLAKKQAVKQGMIHQLLTGMTRLPGYDSPWADIRLGDHVTYVKTVPLSRAQLDATSPLRYLHYGDIHTSSEVRLAAGERPMPRAPRALAKSAGRLQIGDLVFADASEDPDGVGKSVEVISVPPAGVVPGLHTIAARFDKSVLADGFKAYLQFMPAFRNALLRLAAGTKVLATTRSYISSIILTLPSVDEQRAIAAALTDCDEEITALCDRMSKANAIKQGMMQQLLTGRTRLPVAEATS